MDTFAYCCASFAKSVNRAAGAVPLLSPPVTHKDFVPDVLMGRDLIYFKLHGLPGQEYWYGDNWETALHVSAFDDVALHGTVVFVANCFLTESPFLEAILRTGAVVIGGSGENFAQPNALIGADLLGHALRKSLQLGAHPADALQFARLYVTAANTTMKRAQVKATEGERKKHLAQRIKANEDALAFELHRR